MKKQGSLIIAFLLVSAGVIIADGWDPGDDTGTGATLLTPALTIASNGSHTLSSTDYYDWFRVYMTNGYFYTFDSIGGNGDNYANLYSDSSGTTSVAYDDDSGGNVQFSIVNFQASSTGYYYLRVRGYSLGNNWSGFVKYRYSRTLSDAWDPGDNTAAGATVLVPTSSFQYQGVHSLSSSDTNDWYKISMTNTRSYSFYTSDINNYASARLYNSSAATIMTQNLTGYSFNITFTPQVSGIYYLKMIRRSGYTSWQGNLCYLYLPTSDAWDPGDNSSAGATVIVPSTSYQSHGQHVLNSADTNDWYKIRMTNSRSYNFYTSDSFNYSSARLYDSTAATVVTQNLTGYSFNITYVPQVSGNYYLKIIRKSGYASWQGNLYYAYAPLTDSWDPVDNTSAGATVIVPSTSYQSHGQHVLNSSDTNDWYKIYMTNSRSYNFYVYNNNGYASARLYNSTAVTVVTQNLSGYSFDITYAPQVSGYYYLKVIRKSGYSAWQGDLYYAYAPVADSWDPVDNTSPGATVIVPTTSLQSHGQHILNSTDTNDWYSIAMVNTRRYNFFTYDNSGYSSARLYDSTAATVVTQNLTGYSFNITYAPPVSGNYYLKVTRKAGYSVWRGYLYYAYAALEGTLEAADLSTAVLPTMVDLSRSSLVRFVTTGNPASAEIRIYSLRGNLIESFPNGDFSAGYYEKELDPVLYSAGRYIAQIGKERTVFIIIK